MSMSKSAPERRGRPPKGEAAMMPPITIRIPRPMMEAIEAEQEAAAFRGAGKGDVIRELLEEALRSRRAKGRGR